MSPEWVRAPGRIALQRLFSAFPNRWPGVALILLRVVASVIILTQVTLQATHHTGGQLELLLLTLLFGLSGFCLLIGFLTPLAAIFSAVYSVSVALSWIPVPVLSAFDMKIASPETITMFICLALLGPGAYSLDAKLFGRREIVIPTKSRNPEV